jgi:hypothetical protein
MEKKILNEKELKSFTMKLLKEERFIEIDGDTYDIFEEGFWDKLKSGISNAWDSAKGQMAKLGSITKGGKYFGKEKAQAAADTQLDSEMNKRANKMIKQLDMTLKKEFPGFPNMKNKEQFLAAVSEIRRVYDSVVAATQKEKGTPGYLGPKKANNIIKSLRMYVQKLVDYDLASVYRMFNENDERYYNQNIHLISEAPAKGPLTGSKETETEKVYKSNTAPLTLVGIGTALGAFSWLVNTDWFKSLFAAKQTVPVTDWVSQDTEKVLGTVQPGNGLTQTMNATIGTKLSAASTPEDLIKGLEKLGNGNAQKGVDLLTQKGGLFPDSVGAKAALTDIVNNPHGKGDTLGQIFKGKLAGTGKEIGDVLVTKSGGAIVGAITTLVPKIALMTTVKVGAGYLAAKGLGGVLGPLGIGLVAAGAAVKALRVKGLKSSRMKTLKDLLVGMDDLVVPKTVRKKAEPEQEIPAEPVSRKTKKSAVAPEAPAQPQGNATQFNYQYTTPSSTQTTTSFTAPANVPTYGATSTTSGKAKKTAKTTKKAAPKATRKATATV